jgi:phosphomannomutase
MALIQGLLDEGIDVDTQRDGQDITTGLTNRKGQEDGYDIVIQITGSHNPWDGNGFKILSYKGNPLFGEPLVEFFNDIQQRQGWSKEIKEGQLNKQENLNEEHVEALAKVLSDAQNQPLMIADFRGGVAGKVTMALAEKKGYTVEKLNSSEDSLDAVKEALKTTDKVFIALNYEPSPMMEKGVWDPSKPEAYDNIKRLQVRMAEDADLKGRRFAGAVYDGDGDRAGFLDEEGRMVQPERMLIAFYQRMILANEEGVRALNKLGHTVRLALDVRASKVIVDILKKIAQEKGLAIEGEFIAAGYPNHRDFVREELTAIAQLLPRVLAQEQAAVRKLMLEYTSAEASGHFFFNVITPDLFLQKKNLVDDGIASTFMFLYLIGTLNNYELKDHPASELSVRAVDTLFPMLPVTNEIRLDNAPSDIQLKQQLAEDLMIQFLEDNPALSPMPLDELKLKIAEARNNPPKRQKANEPLLLVDGIRLDMTNGVWMLFRKSNTSAVIVFKAEADDPNKKAALVDVMHKLQVSMRKVKESKAAFSSLVLSRFDDEATRFVSDNAMANSWVVDDPDLTSSDAAMAEEGSREDLNQKLIQDRALLRAERQRRPSSRSYIAELENRIGELTEALINMNLARVGRPRGQGQDNAMLPPGGIDLNAKHLNLQSEGEKVNITFDPAMIAQFQRGDFSGVRIQILDVVPINLMPLLGLREEKAPQRLVKA